MPEPAALVHTKASALNVRLLSVPSTCVCRWLATTTPLPEHSNIPKAHSMKAWRDQEASSDCSADDCTV